VNVAETILVFVAAPLAFVLLVALLIFLPGGRKRPRYKPGQPWEHPPVWFEPHPEHGFAAGHGTPGHEGQTKAIGSSVYGEATDAHASHGSAADHGAPAHRPVAAGPLGGARGTW
jgi:hypothetical protein